MTTTLAQISIERAALVTEEALAAQPVLVTPIEAPWVSETPTGLAFAADTPLEIWAPLTVRLIVQQKRIDFALADAINFGRDAYGDIYAQWVQETGLSKKSLQNIAYVGRAIEPSRRREGISFAHHAEVAALPVPDQERLLEAVEQAGMTRYELRDRVRERREELRGRAVEEPECHVWTPQREDLAPDARVALEQRLAGIGKRHEVGYVRGFLDALVWAEVREAFTRWEGSDD